jgi:hypothetical protein
MDEKKFVENYLKPSDDLFDDTYKHPLPPIDGLKKGSQFIVQGKLGKTFSTNIIDKYESESTGIKLIDVYKCSQHMEDGQFVRLVGTMRVAKSGYPMAFLDAAVTNMSPFTQEREPITTRVLIHMPQATDAQREAVFEKLSGLADGAGVVHKEVKNPHMPDFWGPIWLAESKKLDMPLIELIRNGLGEAYVALAAGTEPDASIDYKLVKDQMIHTTAKNEHMLFAKMGLTVDLEAQAAFFSVMTAGVENPS